VKMVGIGLGYSILVTSLVLSMELPNQKLGSCEGLQRELEEVDLSIPWEKSIDNRSLYSLSHLSFHIICILLVTFLV
jgi:hypothetical protein